MRRGDGRYSHHGTGDQLNVWGEGEGRWKKTKETGVTLGDILGQTGMNYQSPEGSR